VARISRERGHQDGSSERGGPTEGRSRSTDGSRAPDQLFFENLHGSGGSLMTARAACGWPDKPEKMPDLPPRAIAQSGPIVLSENASFVCFGS
jgi:hypothetical protein